MLITALVKAEVKRRDKCMGQNAARCKPRRELGEALKTRGVEVKEIGDCVEPRTIWSAMHEGANAALDI